MGDLKSKAKKKGFDPRAAYGRSLGVNTSPSPSIGPKEQTIKIRQDVKRGGTIGAHIGKKKATKSLTRSTGNMTAGRSRSR